MKPVVFFSINEGLFLWNGHHGFLVDYLFDNHVAVWSDLPDSTRRRMLFREHTLLFTHSHPDHYSRRHLREYLELYDSGVYGAGIPESNLSPGECGFGESLLELPGFQVYIL